MPQRFINPFLAYILALLPQSQWGLLFHGIGAGITAKWATLPIVDQALLLAIGADFLTGTGAAFLRRTWSIRACTDGAIAKVMTLILVGAVRMLATSVPAWEWSYLMIAGGFALLNTVSTLRNFRRARIKLPPGVEKIVSQIEAALQAKSEHKGDRK